jgi:Ca2+-binding RTX toxin-like protein
MATNGTNKDDTITGTKFKDKLFGLGGNDKIKGLEGADTIDGGKGNDTLTGDKAKVESDKAKVESYKDTFVFGKASGKDTITDFDVKKDILQIKSGLNGIKKAADVLKHADQKGKDVVIDLGGGNKITLKDVKLADLKKHPGDHFDIN